MLNREEQIMLNLLIKKYERVESLISSFDALTSKETMPLNDYVKSINKQIKKKKVRSASDGGRSWKYGELVALEKMCGDVENTGQYMAETLDRSYNAFNNMICIILNPKRHTPLIKLYLQSNNFNNVQKRALSNGHKSWRATGNSQNLT